MWSENYQDCLEYIDSYWNVIVHKPTGLKIKKKIAGIYYTDLNINDFHHSKKYYTIEVPYNYFTPNDIKFTYIFYWDSYFMFRGLMGTKRQTLMRDMVNNFTYLFNTYGFIPNFNAPASMGRSQPPFLSSMIIDTFLTEFHQDGYRTNSEKLFSTAHHYIYKSWLKTAIKVAQQEYENVWIDKEKNFNHRVQGYMLSRYGDRDIGYSQSSEIESGWDMTSRYYNRCDQFLPIDLNTYLYKYELDFIETARLLGDRGEEKKWKERAEKRKDEMNKLMWDEKEGFYFDFGYEYKQLSDFYSLAGFTPLWGKLATKEQAGKMVKHLNKFESRYGLMITAKESLAHSIDLSKIQRRYRPAIEDIIKPKQWDYPNIWSPLEYLTVIGLLQYGFVDEARRIMNNSVKAHAAIFRKYGTFSEKINGETGDVSESFHYAHQPGFGWTNAVFYRYIQILDTIDSGKDIYKEPKLTEPPYNLSILH